MDETTNLLTVSQSDSEGYRARTIHNARQADVTLAIAADMNTAGERLTHSCAGSKYLGFVLSSELSPRAVAHSLGQFMHERKASSLNVAGNGLYSLSRYPFIAEHRLALEHGLQFVVNLYMLQVLAHTAQRVSFTHVYSGGQTGFDMAGIAAAMVLGIPATATLPKGYRQRFEDNKDVYSSESAIKEQLDAQVSKLRDYIQTNRSVK